MQNIVKNIIMLITGLCLFSCEYNELEPVIPPTPYVPVLTTNLESKYSTKDPSSVTDKIWKETDYTTLSFSNGQTGKTYGDGFLNMTSTFNGIGDVNNGDSINFTVKSVYTDSKIYFLLSWDDNSYSIPNELKLYNGSSDSRKSDSTHGWTTQFNDDELFISFVKDSIANTYDVWNWSFALTQPLGYCLDMNYNPNDSLKVDAGTPMFVKNYDSSRTAPIYEWDGSLQVVDMPNGKSVILDPAYYIYNKTSFVGNPSEGQKHFNELCALCHGEDGSGYASDEFPNVYAPSFQTPNYGRDSRESYLTKVRGIRHEGSNEEYFGHIEGNQTAIDDLMARVKGMSGVPGNYLQTPSGSCADVECYTGLSLSNIDKRNGGTYKIMIVRNLNTNNNDDVEFNTTQSYKFDIKLSNGDEINFVQSQNKYLTFK